MKKRYIKPEVCAVRLCGATMISASGVSSDNGIPYGGVDEEGQKEPDAKANHYNVWDDDWREDSDGY